MDNCYIWMLLKYGVVFLFVFACSAFLFLEEIMKKNEIIMAIIVVSYILYALSENTMFWLVFNPFMIMSKVMLIVLL